MNKKSKSIQPALPGGAQPENTLPGNNIDFILPACVCGSLRQATRALTLVYDQALQPAGLTAMQFQILSTIQTVKKAAIKDLVVISTLDQTTLTRSLAILVHRGWLHTEQQADRRSKLFALTKQGKAALARAQPLWSVVQQSALNQLRESDWRATRVVLNALIRFGRDNATTSPGHPAHNAP